MAEQHGNSPGVEAGVDGVEDRAGHGYGEVELVHGGDVGGHNRHDLAAADSERFDGRGDLEASPAGLRPGVGGGVVYNRRAIAIGSSSSVEEA